MSVLIFYFNFRLENFETISTYVKNIENMKVEIDELKNKENNLEAFLNEKCEELRKIKEELNDKEIVVENLKREVSKTGKTFFWKIYSNAYSILYFIFLASRCRRHEKIS